MPEPHKSNLVLHASPGLRLARQAGLRIFRLHLPPAAATSGLPQGLPTKTGELCQGALLCLGLRPGEWLLVQAESAGSGSLAELERVATQAGGALLEQSDALAVFQVRGPAAPWLLGKLSALDFAGWCAAGVSCCAQTRLARQRCIVQFLAPAPGREAEFSLYFDHSLADWTAELLLDAVPHAEELATRTGTWPNI